MDIIPAGEEMGISLVTATEFLGVGPKLLEARMRELYQEGEELD